MKPFLIAAVFVLSTASALAQEAVLKFRDATALGGGGSVAATVGDPSGIVVAAGSRTIVRPGSFFVAQADGFLPHFGIAPWEGEEVIKLTPSGDDNELTTLYELWYRTAGDEGEKLLTRPVAEKFVITVMSPLRGVRDPDAVSKAIADLQPAVPWIRLVERRPEQAMPTNATRVYVYVNDRIPENVAGWAWAITEGSVITEAYIELRSAYFESHTLAHELVHALGLGHLHRAEGLMSRTGVSWDYPSLIPAERRALWLMQFAEPGTAWPGITPDYARFMGAASQGGAVSHVLPIRVTLACSLPRSLVTP
ncbi:MAG: hypothetical protein QY311_01650 [Candidatus Paceibacterota bacterium]|nr:MAG: hypothetical protein QY311_01650 [Candidatus Paceibacterota bacterium]